MLETKESTLVPFKYSSKLNFHQLLTTAEVCGIPLMPKLKPEGLN